MRGIVVLEFLKRNLCHIQGIDEAPVCQFINNNPVFLLNDAGNHGKVCHVAR